jgi:hypothetical protein
VRNLSGGGDKLPALGIDVRACPPQLFINWEMDDGAIADVNRSSVQGTLTAPTYASNTHSHGFHISEASP